MLTLQSIGKASDAALYFSQDNYYTREEGIEHSQWFGDGAELLSLEGNVDTETFNRLLDGVFGDEALGRIQEGVRRHRPGYDLTLGAPKSVSILSEIYGVTAVRDAHDQAVRQTLEYIQSELLEARVTHDNHTYRVPVKNAVFATFTHDVSRELDPHLHTHNILMNGVHDGHGWRSITAEKLYSNQKIIGLFYRRSLANNLTSLGYELRHKSDDKTLFEIEGISEEMLAHFSTRSQQIRDYFDDRNMAYDPAVAKQVALLTRSKKRPIERRVLQDIWQTRVSDFTLPGHLLSPTQNPRKPDRNARSAVDGAITHLEEREAAYTKEELFTAALAFSQHLSPAVLLKEIDRRINCGILVDAPDHPDLDKSQPYFTTHSMLRMEEELADTLATNRGVMSPMASERDIERTFKKTHLNPQQLNAVSSALRSTDRFFAIQGDPGVGKTTLLSAYKDVLKKRGFDLVAMAPSYQAVSELSDSLSIKGVVVDRFLVDESLHSKPRKSNKIVWVVDEASMLSIDKINDIMDAAVKQNARVLFSGDHQQLESVGAGRAFWQMQEQGIDIALVTERLRQKNEGLKSVVHEVMNSRYGSAIELLDLGGHLKEQPSEPAALEAAAASWLAMSSEERACTAIIAPANEQRSTINDAIREGLQKEGGVSSKSRAYAALSDRYLTEYQKRQATSYKKGDVVRFSQAYTQSTDRASDAIEKGEYFVVAGIEADNNQLILQSSVKKQRVVVIDPAKRGAHIAGGMSVYRQRSTLFAKGDAVRWTDSRNDYKLKRNAELTVERVGRDYIRLRESSTARSIRINYRQSDYLHLEYNYAKTAYGVQGATVKNAIFVASSWRKNTVNQKSLKVAVTRASERVTLFVDDKKELINSLMRRTGKNTVAASSDRTTSKSRSKRERTMYALSNTKLQLI